MSPQLIGDGSFGCVYLPYIPCDNKHKNNLPTDGSFVGKIFKTVPAYVDENAMNNAVKRIDPNNNYFITQERSCRVSRNKIPRGTCTSLKAGEHIDWQIIMKNGGKRLKTYMNGRTFTNGEIATLMKNVFKGVKCLIDNNYIHQDIKPENIVVFNGIAKIIDFGWLISKADFYTKNSLFNRKYGINGPEYRVNQADLQTLSLNELVTFEKRLFRDMFSKPMTGIEYNTSSLSSLRHSKMPLAEKADVYSCGTILLLLTQRLSSPPTNAMIGLVEGCLMPNPEERYTIHQALTIIGVIEQEAAPPSPAPRASASAAEDPLDAAQFRAFRAAARAAMLGTPPARNGLISRQQRIDLYILLFHLYSGIVKSATRVNHRVLRCETFEITTSGPKGNVVISVQTIPPGEGQNISSTSPTWLLDFFNAIKSIRISSLDFSVTKVSPTQANSSVPVDMLYGIFLEEVEFLAEQAGGKQPQSAKIRRQTRKK